MDSLQAIVVFRFSGRHLRWPLIPGWPVQHNGQTATEEGDCGSASRSPFVHLKTISPGAVVMMKIRRYRSTDRDAVWELHNVALLQIGAHAGNGPWDDDLHRIEAEYVTTGGEFFVGIANGRIIAMGALLRHSAGQASIRRMRVHPDVQRRGLGRQMLSALEQRAAELGFRTLTLDTTVQQVPAIQLYTRSGYKEVGRSRKAGFEVVEFQKKIG